MCDLNFITKPIRLLISVKILEMFSQLPKNLGKIASIARKSTKCSQDLMYCGVDWVFSHFMTLPVCPDVHFYRVILHIRTYANKNHKKCNISSHFVTMRTHNPSISLLKICQLHNLLHRDLYPAHNRNRTRIKSPRHTLTNWNRTICSSFPHIPS